MNKLGNQHGKNADPFNNNVTYNKQWDTPENLKALNTLETKYFDMSEASPSCPTAWAPEVLEMLTKIDEKLGIAKNEKTIRGYYTQGNILEWFIINPIKNFFSSVKRIFTLKYEGVGVEVIKELVGDVLQPMKYGCKAFTVRYINPLLNKIFRPKVTLGQIKEKYGTLRLYYHCDPEYNDFIDALIEETENKLVAKGCYVR